MPKSLDTLRANFRDELEAFTDTALITLDLVEADVEYDLGTTQEEIDLDKAGADVAGLIVRHGLHTLAEAVRYIKALEDELYESVVI